MIRSIRRSRWFRPTAMLLAIGMGVLSSAPPAAAFRRRTARPRPLAVPAAPAVATPGETVSTSYGANGRTESTTDNRGTTSIGYITGTDIPSSITDPVTGTISYTYGQGGEKATAVLPGGGTWSYHYRSGWFMSPKPDIDSTMPMLERIVDDQGREVKYWLDTRGGLHHARQAITGGISTDTLYTFESNGNNVGRGRLLQVQTTKTVPTMMGPLTTVVHQNDYSYSASGERTANAISDQNGLVRTEQYGYDELSRLTRVDYGDGQTQTYTFDPMGNRTGKTDSVNGNDASTFNAANMLLTKNGQGYTYDANGNTLTGGGRTNSWDSANRLTQIVFNGTTTTHTYGSDGLRRRTVKGADTTDYILAGDSVIRTLQNGVLDKTYFHGLRGPEYERTGAGNPTWYVYDGLGSVVGLLDVNGSLVSTRKYDGYGSVRGGTGISGSKHKFVGSLGHPSEDDAGLISKRARWITVTQCLSG